MAKRMEQLKKIKMPAKPMAEQEAELDIGLEIEGDMPEGGEAPEMMDEMADDMPEEMAGEDMMADLDDDMIIEEMLKRGLTLPAEGKEEEEDAEEIDLEDMV